MKTIFQAVNTASQSVAASGAVNLGNAVVSQGVCGNCIGLNSAGDTVNVAPAGVYDAFANLDFQAAAAGPVTLQLYNNGVAVPGAEATVTAATATTYSVAFKTPISVKKSCACICNKASLQIIASAAITVSNSNLILEH